FGWLTLFIGLPLAYLILSALNRFLGTWTVAVFWRFRELPAQYTITLLPAPIRLLSLAFAIHWAIPHLPLPLLSRHFWTGTSVVIALLGCVWLFIWLTRLCERYMQRRFLRQNR